MTAPTSILGDDGYAVIDGALSRRSVRRIASMLRRFDVPDDHGFFASPVHAHGDVAAGFDRDVKRLAQRRWRRVVPGHRPFMVAVTSKGARSTTPIKYHQDWTYTDEREHRPVFLWCPLVDVGEDTGALRVVPGSHRWTSAIRPSRHIEVTEAFQDELDRRSVPVPLRAGQALAFDPALCHGSKANQGDSRRPAITVAFAPTGAQLVHFHLDGDGLLSGYEVDDAFFTTNPYGTAPEGRTEVAPWDRPLGAVDFEAVLASSVRPTA
ncbi:MAG TPA: phytanoyl-CoA dioxygenase family protein [Acidimicrobiales bacterium]|nr:phytanoyl-CoA dioxygenase family protein [Acidimicrobiales bacterium]